MDQERPHRQPAVGAFRVRGWSGVQAQKLGVEAEAACFIQTDGVVPGDHLDLDALDARLPEDLHGPIHQKLPAAPAPMLRQGDQIIDLPRPRR